MCAPNNILIFCSSIKNSISKTRGRRRLWRGPKKLWWCFFFSRGCFQLGGGLIGIFFGFFFAYELTTGGFVCKDFFLCMQLQRCVRGLKIVWKGFCLAYYYCDKESWDFFFPGGCARTWELKLCQTDFSECYELSTMENPGGLGGGEVRKSVGQTDPIFSVIEALVDS